MSDAEEQPCWVTAHIIEAALVVAPGATYVAVAQSALDDVKTLGVAAVVATRAPEASGFDPAHQTMVMLEFDAHIVPESDDARVRQLATEAIIRLQSHGVVPEGEAIEAVVEFGDTLIQTFQDHMPQ